jgi:integrase
MKLDIPPSDKMSFENQSKLISRMTSCWNFFEDEYPEYVSVNVFKSKSIRVNPVKRKDRRGEFTEDDLHLIFNPKTYLPAVFDNPTGRKNTIQYPHYFVLILGVFTGCRLEELCMMRCKDITKVNGLWLYRIREEGEYGDKETTVKTASSERDIPLHSALVNTLGFVRYVKHINKLGHERVFHELKKVGGRYYFKDYPEFKPNLSPREMFKLGSFGGTYWRPIKSKVIGKEFLSENRIIKELTKNL